MITASLTAALALTLGTIGGFPDDSKSNAAAGVKLTFVDLQWIGNQKLSEKIGDLDGNDLAAVPQGTTKARRQLVKVGEQLIRVRGQRSPVATREVPGLLRSEALKLATNQTRSLPVQVGSTLRPVSTPPRQSNTTNTMMAMMSMRSMTQPIPEPPEAVRGIVIGAGRFDTLHILHTTMFGNAFGAEDGTEIGTYVVHYGDRTEERIPIIYGRVDARDWWRSSDPAETSNARLAWGGKNAAVGETDQIRLFSSEWKNPRPNTKVMSIDFETKGTACSPFLIALTLERAVYHEGNTARPLTNRAAGTAAVDEQWLGPPFYERRPHDFCARLSLAKTPSLLAHENCLASQARSFDGAQAIGGLKRPRSGTVLFFTALVPTFSRGETAATVGVSISGSGAGPGTVTLMDGRFLGDGVIGNGLLDRFHGLLGDWSVKSCRSSAPG